VFVQVIRGTVATEQEVLELLDRWREELAGDAVGWLGSTGGVTPDGELVLTARFASAEDARHNGDRPEQTAWWHELEERLTGPVTVHDCEDVALVRDGGQDEAGFVQVMVWPAGAATTAAIDATTIADVGTALVEHHRPDVLGGLVGVAEDGAVVQVVYFSSEDEAREAETRTAPDDAASDEMRVLEPLGEPIYLDLPRPRMLSG
jgi:hypothetical protein